MLTREFKATMVDDFRTRWLEATAIDEGVPIAMITFVYDAPELIEFSERISGKIVTLIEEDYLQGDIRFFEKLDDSYVIPENLFTKI